MSVSPTPSETPTTESTAPTTSATPEPDPCPLPEETATGEWETEDVPFPKQDVVRKQWTYVSIEGKFKNTTRHDIVVESATQWVAQAEDSKQRPKFPTWTSASITVDRTVEPGDTITAPGPAWSGLMDWLERWPIYGNKEPRVGVSFTWHYKDRDAERECVTIPTRTVPVGVRPWVVFATPWVVKARFVDVGLRATVRRCAGDHDEVFNAGAFRVEQDGLDDVAATGARLKVPVAAKKCRNVEVLFRGVSSDEAVIAVPSENDSQDPDVPLRWTLGAVGRS